MTPRFSALRATGTLLVLTSLTLIPVFAGAAARPIRTFMLNSGLTPAARGKFVVKSGPKQTAFNLTVTRLKPSTTYSLLVGGRVVDRLTTNASGAGKIARTSRAGGRQTQQLNYDPRQGRIAVAGPDGVELTGDVPDSVEESESLDEIRLDLTAATGVVGSASAEFREKCGRMKFEVRVEGGAPGSYDLFVGSSTGGQIVGQIVVDATGHGEIEFDSTPVTDDEGDDPVDDGMDLLLTFDPRGQVIEIQQAGVASFSGTLPLVPPTPVGDDDGDDDDDGGEHD